MGSKIAEKKAINLLVANLFIISMLNKTKYHADVQYSNNVQIRYMDNDIQFMLACAPTPKTHNYNPVNCSLLVVICIMSVTL